MEKEQDIASVFINKQIILLNTNIVLFSTGKSIADDI